MKRLILGLAFGFLIAADNPKEEAAKKDQGELQGAWLLRSAERDGKPVGEEKIKNVKICFKGEKVMAKEGDKDFEMTYKLDPTKKPPEIDITYTVGPRKGESSQGIYLLEGDTLKICMSRGNERPTEFATRPDSSLHLMVFEREKR